MDSKIIQLNVEGEICPYPLIKTIKKVEEQKRDLKDKGVVLEITTDCLPAIENIPFELQKRGFRAEVQKIEPLKWKIIIKR
jgi:TusA-related sulfurtransferase